MAKPYVHAVSTARRFGGKPEDYLAIHSFLDLSKSVLPDNRHRALTHTTWFLSNVLERVFGATITNSAGRVVSVRDVGEMHVAEDFHGHIPTAEDFLGELPYHAWMEGREPPPSHRKVADSVKVTRTTSRWDRD